MTEALVQIAPNVYIFPRDENPERVQPNVGIIVAGRQTVLIDAGNSPRHARRIMIALDDIQAPPVRQIMYTHSHWDHVFGAMVFGAPAAAHELCRKQLAELSSKPWSHSYVQEEIQRSPAREAALRAMSRAVEDWRNFRVVQPEVIFSQSLTLYFEGVTLELEHVGGAHAPDSVVARLPEQRVLFLGDCYYLPPLHLRRPEDTLDFAMLRRLVSDAYDWYIDSHGQPMSRAEIQKLAELG